MRGLGAALAVSFALTFAAGASADVVVGVNDDAGKITAFAPWVYGTMYNEALKLNSLTVQWDEAKPDEIPAQDAIASAISAADANHVEIELDLYPLHSQAFTGGRKC